MEVEQVWEFAPGEPSERLYAPFLCDADWLPHSGTVLVTFGGLRWINGESVLGDVQPRIIEVTHEAAPRRVFELVIHNELIAPTYTVYRSSRIRDLYPTGDLNQDGEVDDYDFRIIQGSFGSPASGRTDSRDINGDGLISTADLEFLRETLK